MTFHIAYLKPLRQLYAVQYFRSVQPCDNGDDSRRFGDFVPSGLDMINITSRYVCKYRTENFDTRQTLMKLAETASETLSSNCIFARIICQKGFGASFIAWNYSGL
jgi:hypothetical protein